GLLVRAQVELLSPGTAMLQMQLEVDLGDRFEIEESVRTCLGYAVRSARAQAFTVDAAVDHHVGDVDPSWPELAGEGLTHRSQPGFGGGEAREGWFAAQGCRRTGEEQRALMAGQEAAYHFSTEHEAGEGAAPPSLLEGIRAQLEGGSALGVAR